MKRSIQTILVVGLVLSVTALGCEQRAKTSTQAIEIAKTKPTVDSQIDYLLKQANAFLNSRDFDQAVNVAKYILSDLDKTSQSAKKIIEQAKVDMASAAQEAVGDVKAKFGSLGQ